MESKVSIIVPAYNVEKYIEKCIETILNQTYENIEVIVVDDGSIDKTPFILDEIAKKDNRVRIVHTKNCGVSAARNSALDIASGEYVVFVDGDDYLSCDYVEYMIDLVCKTGKQFCTSKNHYSSINDKQVKNEKVKILSEEEATCYFLSPDVIVYSPNCIISMNLLNTLKLRFSTSLFYGEGLTFTSTLAQHSGGIGLGNRKVYYYRRNNEISATTKFNIEKMRNGEIALNKLKDNITIKSDAIDTMWLLHMCTFYLGAIVRIKALKLIQAYRTEYREWSKFLKKNVPTLILKKNISLYRKCMLIVGCVSPGLLAKMDKKRRKSIAQNSV